MKRFFRGSPWLLPVLWVWNLTWMVVSLYYFTQGSKWHAVWAVLFLLLWAFLELVRVGGNHLYDEAQAKAVKVRADEEAR